MDELRGRVAVVTGAASGIGHALAGRFASEGMSVVMADIEGRALASAADEVRATGAEVEAALVDVADASAVDALRDRALERFGGVHVLCNNAGVVTLKPLWEQTLDDWRWVVGVFPKRARAAVNGAGIAGWATLQNFVKVQILVATIDAVGIGLGAFLLGVPLAIPIAILVFLGSFIPIVGAVVTGALAVFVALIYNGWVIALIMLGIVLLVQQVEGHVLHRPAAFDPDVVVAVHHDFQHLRIGERVRECSEIGV